MSPATNLSNALQEVSLDLNTIRDSVLRTALCEVCERLLRWALQTPMSGQGPYARTGEAAVISDCRIAEAYCRRAGLERHADRLLYLLEQLSGVPHRSVALPVGGN
jgi:hypothetical protein